MCNFLKNTKLLCYFHYSRATSFALSERFVS